VADTDSPRLREIANKWWTPDPAIVAKLPRGGKDPSIRCTVCKGWHKTGAAHLDFVGHADLTRALIEIDDEWQWEPVALDENGLPRIVQRGNNYVLWGRVTLLGKTMLAVGTCETNKGDVDKELVGDMLRNAGMRFGIFGSLWSKTDGWENTDAPSEPGASGPHVEANGGAAPTVVAPDKPVDTMTVQELAAYAQTIGVPYKGSKAEMVYVLKAYEGAATGFEPFELTPPENPPERKDDHDKPFAPTVAGPSMAREALSGSERHKLDSAAKT
jgi:hypothetical protein